MLLFLFYWALGSGLNGCPSLRGGWCLRFGIQIGELREGGDPVSLRFNVDFWSDVELREVGICRLGLVFFLLTKENIVISFGGNWSRTRSIY